MFEFDLSCDFCAENMIKLHISMMGAVFIIFFYFLKFLTALLWFNVLIAFNILTSIQYSIVKFDYAIVVFIYECLIDSIYTLLCFNEATFSQLRKSISSLLSLIKLGICVCVCLQVFFFCVFVCSLSQLIVPLELKQN